MRICTWNINSVRLRMPLLLRLIDEHKPDVICLQETKVVDDAFPHAPLLAKGYKHRHVHGMKSYNGVAILSRLPLGKTGAKHWCGKEDRRHIVATLPGGTEVHCVYVPAGGDIPDPEANDKFAHKLQFVEQQAAWWKKQKKTVQKILVGDLNIAPQEHDVWSHKQMRGIVSHTPAEIERLENMQKSHGWVDAMRHFVPPEEKLYSWWSYRAQDWKKSDRGRRLDHIWVTPGLADGMKRIHVLREARGWQQPSDHVPVMLDLA
ncbi:MAG: exodeoxyribonuclease III [Alphaproteobacteria bacterium]|nr:exodeoxyribonuclease III [Alphaproteobacteria bacterium]